MVPMLKREAISQDSRLSASRGNNCLPSCSHSGSRCVTDATTLTLHCFRPFWCINERSFGSPVVCHRFYTVQIFRGLLRPFQIGSDISVSFALAHWRERASDVDPLRLLHEPGDRVTFVDDIVGHWLNGQKGERLNSPARSADWQRGSYLTAERPVYRGAMVCRHSTTSLVGSVGLPNAASSTCCLRR